MTYSQDRSRNIRQFLGDLENNLAVTVLLVMVVVVASLGLRTSTLVGVAVPGSFLAAILMLYGMGYSINVVVLFGLILAAGNVVDGAIVVTEYADRKMTEGLDRRSAYSLAARRMAGPIIASTATQLAAFAPLLFWPGVAGEFMKFLPISQFAALTAALLMALIFVPVLGALVGRPNGPVLRLGASPVPGTSGREAPDRSLCRRSASGPASSRQGPAAGRSCCWSPSSGTTRAMATGSSSFPRSSPRTPWCWCMPVATCRSTNRTPWSAKSSGAFWRWTEFASVYSRTGQHRAGFGRDVPPDVIGQITLEFKDWRLRRRAAEILEDVRQRTADLAGIIVELRKQKEGRADRQAGPGPAREPHAGPVAGRGRTGPARHGGGRRLRGCRGHPAAARHRMADRARSRPGGQVRAGRERRRRRRPAGHQRPEVGEFRSDDASDSEIDIVVRYPVEERSLSALDAITVPTPAGAVPISGFVTRSAQPKVNQIDRVDGERVMTVRADVAPGVLADDKVHALSAWLEAHPLGPKVSYSFKGEDEDQKESAGFPDEGLRHRPVPDGHHPADPVQQLLQLSADPDRGDHVHDRRHRSG